MRQWWITESVWMKDNGEWHAVRNNRHDNGAMVMKDNGE